MIPVNIENEGGDVRVVAFGGRAGAGKSTCARILCNTLGGSVKNLNREERVILATQIHIAAPVKEIASKLFNWSGDKTTYFTEDRRIDESKGRGLLQAIGTKGREINPNVWIDSAIRDISTKCYVRCENTGRLGVPAPLNLFAIDDLRYVNEAQRLRRMFGPRALLVRVEAPGAEPGGHSSETDLDGFDDWNRVIKNDGTMDDLYVEVMALLEHYKRIL